MKVDMVWFSILLAVTLQTCWLSPPVALSAYYLKGVMPEWEPREIYKGMLPFMGLQWLAVLILYFFPQIILVLPNMMFGTAIAENGNAQEDHHETTRPSSRAAGLAAGVSMAPVRRRRRKARSSAGSCRARNPAGTPHMTLLNKFASNVEKMSGGRLAIEVLTSGAIVNPFEILDAVNKGVIEAGQWWTHYATGKHPAGGLFSAPLGGSGSGLDQMGQLGWYMRGGGRELYVEYYQKMLRADVMPFLYAPDGPECFGWFKKPITSVAEFTKLRFRISSGLPSDVLEGHGRRADEPAGAGADPGRRARHHRRRRMDQSRERPAARPARRVQVLLDPGPAPGDRHRRRDVQRREVAFASARPAGDRRDRAHGFAVRRDALLRAREREGAEGDQGEGRDDVRCACRTTRRPSSSRRRRCSASLEAKDPFFKKVLELQRAFANVVVPYTRETSKLSTLDQRRGRGELSSEPAANSPLFLAPLESSTPAGLKVDGRVAPAKRTSLSRA